MEPISFDPCFLHVFLSLFVAMCGKTISDSYSLILIFINNAKHGLTLSFTSSFQFILFFTMKYLCRELYSSRLVKYRKLKFAPTNLVITKQDALTEMNSVSTNNLVVFCWLLNNHCPKTTIAGRAGSGKFRRELRARLCCSLFNAIPNIKAHQHSNRPKTRASLIAHIHESIDGRAHRRCKSAKFLRCLPRPTSSRAILYFIFDIFIFTPMSFVGC